MMDDDAPLIRRAPRPAAHREPVAPPAPAQKAPKPRREHKEPKAVSSPKKEAAAKPRKHRPTPDTFDTVSEKTTLQKYHTTVKNNFWTLAFVVVLVFVFVLKIQSDTYNATYEEAMSQQRADNYYERLGLADGADKTAVKKAYYTLSLTWHPDKNPNCEDCAEKFAKIAKAYEVLSNDDKKAAYDSGTLIYDPIPSDTIELEDATFDQMVNSSSIWLIQAYADWSDECSSLAEIWEKTATYLQGSAYVGRFNFEKQTALQKRFSIRVVPTVFVLVDGEATVFNGIPSAKTLANHVFRHMKHARAVTAANHEAWINHNRDIVKALLFANSDSMKPRIVFSSHALKMQGILAFGDVRADRSPELVAMYNVTKTPAIVLLREASAQPLVVTKLTAPHVSSVLARHKYLSVTRLNYYNFQDMCNTGENVCVLYLYSDQLNKDHFNVIKQLADSHNAREAENEAKTENDEEEVRTPSVNVQFAFADASKVPSLASALGGSSQVVAVMGGKQQASTFNGSLEDSKSLDAWVSSLEAGKGEFTPLSTTLHVNELKPRASVYSYFFNTNVKSVVVAILLSIAGYLALDVWRTNKATKKQKGRTEHIEITRQKLQKNQANIEAERERKRQEAERHRSKLEAQRKQAEEDARRRQLEKEEREQKRKETAASTKPVSPRKTEASSPRKQAAPAKAAPAKSATRASSGSAPSNNQIEHQIRSILNAGDPFSLTPKMIRAALAEHFGVDLEDRKDYINNAIQQAVAQWLEAHPEEAE